MPFGPWPGGSGGGGSSGGGVAPFLPGGPAGAGYYWALDNDAGNDATGAPVVAGSGHVFGAGFPTPFKTWGAFIAKFFFYGNGSDTVVMFKTRADHGNYIDGDGTLEDFDWRGVEGYRYIRRSASLDLTNNAADLVQAGFVSIDGVTYTLDVGPTVSSFPVVAGAFAVNGMVGFRVRFVTGAAAGKLATIQANTATTLVPNVNITAGIAAGDTFVIERPGVRCRRWFEGDCSTQPAEISNATGAAVIANLCPVVGFGWTGNQGRGTILGAQGDAGSAPTYVGCEQVNVTNTTQVVCEPGASFTVRSSYVDESDTSRAVNSYIRMAGQYAFNAAANLVIQAWFDVSVVNAGQLPNYFSARRMNIMDASGFFAQGIYLPPSGGSDPGTVNATGAANLFGTGEFGPSSVATIRPVKFVAPAPGALGGFGLCTVNRGANIRNCDFQNMGANPAVLIHGDGGYGVRLDGMTGATGNTDVGIDTTQAKGVNVVLGAGNTVTGTVGDIRVNGGQIQTHANYTVSSYRDAGANFIQGSAGNTSNPRDSFTGLHIGDVGPVAEYFAKQNVMLGLPPKFPSGAEWIQGFYCQPSLNAALTAVRVELYKNNAATGQFISVPAGSNAQVSDFAHPIQFAAGDYYDWVVTSNAAVGNVRLSLTPIYT